MSWAQGTSQPNQSTLLVRDRLEDDLRGGPLQQDGLAAGKEAAHPVELGPGMVQGRDAQEDIVVADLVVLLLHFGGLGQAAVLMQDGLGEACGTRGEVNGSVVIIGDEDLGRGRGAVGSQLPVALGKGGALSPI